MLFIHFPGGRISAVHCKKVQIMNMEITQVTPKTNGNSCNQAKGRDFLNFA